MSSAGRTLVPTAEDVARLAGVSKSAVSRAFTPGASVSARTRGLVEEAARALGYRPNPIARSLSTRRSAIVGVAMAYMDQVYAPLLTRMSERLTEEGFRLLLFKAKPAEIADAELDNILHYNVDALVLVSVEFSRDFAGRCQQIGVPLVVINPTRDAGPAATVAADNAGGGCALGAYLLRGGHRRFAFMAGERESAPSQARLAGFTAALAGAGLAPPPVEVGHYNYEGALPAARRLLSAAEPPDAIFCASDAMACAVIDVARREFGLAVGSALSVVGFDNEAIAGWPIFDITTYTMPIAPMVDRAIDQLRSMWTDPADRADAIVPGEIIVRSSARRPRVG